MSGEGLSARREVAGVDEHQRAVAQLDRPPPRRVDDVMLTDVHAVARAVAEILDDDSRSLAVRARVDAHRGSDGDLDVRRAVVFWLPVAQTHGYRFPPGQ